MGSTVHDYALAAYYNTMQLLVFGSGFPIILLNVKPPGKFYSFYSEEAQSLFDENVKKCLREQPSGSLRIGDPDLFKHE